MVESRLTGQTSGDQRLVVGCKVKLITGREGLHEDLIASVQGTQLLVTWLLMGCHYTVSSWRLDA